MTLILIEISRSKSETPLFTFYFSVILYSPLLHVLLYHATLTTSDTEHERGNIMRKIETHDPRPCGPETVP